MKIKELELINFHGFDKRYINFAEQFTILVGDNGTGKTAILDGLSIALGSFLSGLNGVKSRHIRKDEIHLKTYSYEGISDIQMQFPVEVNCTGLINEKKFNWSRAINGKNGSTTSKEAKSIMEYAASLQKKVQSGDSVILPVISYYGTGILWVQKKEYTEITKKNNRLEGYSNCLDPASNEQHFLRWIEKMTYVEIQRKETPKILNAVLKAIKTCMIKWDKLEFDIDSGELRAISYDKEIIPFRLLSDGVRNTIGLVADLAHRMAQLNPDLGESVIETTPGVVLIDEIDLHLHPNWQRRIIEDLKRTFPKVQFIATTHSPFIIQSLEEGELRRLHEKDDDEVVNKEEYVNKSIEDITEEVMEIENVQRSKKLNDMYKVAQQYYTLLQKGKESSENEVEILKQELDRLESLYSQDVAYYAFLQMERTAAGLGDKNNETY